MPAHRPLHWHDGLFVRSHHFQQWDAYLADLARTTLGLLEPDAWGVVEMEVDEEELRREVFQCNRLTVIFPEGAALRYPGNATRPRGEFPGLLRGAGGSLDVFLAIRAEDQHGVNYREPGGTVTRPTRFLIHRETVDDLGRAENPQNVEFLQYEAHVLFEGQDLTGFETIRIARVRPGRDQARPFVLDDAFAPACLRVAGAPPIQRWIARVARAVREKAGESHRDKRALAGGGAATLDACRRLLLSHVLHSFLPALVFELEPGAVHPRRAFHVLARLAGALAADCEDVDPREFIRTERAYDHRDPLASIRPLCEQILDVLERGSRGGFDEVRMERAGDRYVARLPASARGATSRVYLAVRTARPADEVLRAILPSVKLAAPERLEAVVRGALHGIPREPSPGPAVYPKQREQCLFEIARRGPEWEAAERDGALAAFLPLEDASAEASVVIAWENPA